MWGAVEWQRIPFEDHFGFTIEDFCGEPGLDAVVEGVATGVITIRTRGGLDGPQRRLLRGGAGSALLNPDPR